VRDSEVPARSSVLRLNSLLSVSPTLKEINWIVRDLRHYYAARLRSAAEPHLTGGHIHEF